MNEKNIIIRDKIQQEFKLTAKEFLQQGYEANLKVKSQKKRLKNLREDACSANVHDFDNIRVQSSRTGSKLEGAVEKIIEEETRLRTLIVDEIQLIHKIEDVISEIKDPRYRMVLTFRHVNYMGFGEIAKAMHYNHDYVRYELYVKALSKIKTPSKI